MHYHTLGISLTNKCTANCRMCCYACSPNGEFSMPFNTVMDLIKQTQSIDYMHEVVFSGGEPFEDAEKLLSYITHATNCGLFASTYTNGFWCTTEKKTKQILMDFKKAGLKIIRTSFDSYHNEFIPKDNLKNLLRASKDVGLKVTLNVGVDKTSVYQTNAVVFDLGDAILDVDMVIYPFSYVGSAIEHLSESDMIKCRNLNSLQCKQDGVFTVMYDGNAYPCCTPGNIQAFALGNIYEQPLRTLIEGYKYNKFYSLIMTKGLSKIARDIQAHTEIELDNYYVDSCDFCYKLFSDNRFCEQILKLYTEEGIA